MKKGNFKKRQDATANPFKIQQYQFFDIEKGKDKPQKFDFDKETQKERDRVLNLAY